MGDGLKVDDMIVDILARVRRVMPAFSQAQAREIEAQIRQDWGGTQSYVAKDMKRLPHEKERIRQKLRHHNIEETAKSEGVSRRTLYRMLKK